MSKKSNAAAIMKQTAKASVPQRLASERSMPDKASTGILVLGMHRSGTSAITRVMNLLGVELGNKLMPAQSGVNEKGFWEHVDAVAIHERLLRWHGSNWSDIRQLPEIDPARGVGQQAVTDARELIRRDFGHSPLWAIKDPRMSLFTPVWLQAMSAEHMQPKFIISVRHPEEVAASLGKRDGLTRGHAHLLWGHHVVEALKGSRGFPRAVSDYAGLLKDWRKQTDSIAAALSISWPEAGEAAASAVSQFLSDDHRHHRQSSAGLLSEDSVERRVDEMYSCLARIAEGHNDWAKLEEASREFQEVSSVLVPHLSELLKHVWMHADRADQALLEVARSKTGVQEPTAEPVAALRAELAEKNGHIAALGEEVSGLRTHTDALTGLRGELESRQHALGLEAGILRSELRARDGRMDALQQVLMEKEQRLVVAAEHARHQQGFLSELRAHADALTGLRGELESKLHALESEAGILRSELHARDDRMDALQQLLMEKEQRLVVAAEHARHQQGLLSELRAHADALTVLRSELESRLNSREVEANDLRRDLDTSTSRLSILQGINNEQEKLLAEAKLKSETLRMELDSERKGRRETMEELNNTADELGQRLSQLEIQLADTRHALHRRELKLQDVSSQLELRRTELARILHSNSWKLSAPLRWLRNRIDAIRHGRPTASYKQLLEAPMALGSHRLDDEPTVDAISVEPTMRSAVSPPMQKTYLDALFAHELSSPAPEFKEYGDVAVPGADSLRAKLIAFYLPQFHPFAENDEWWGKGFTEWTNVTKALPQFLGHYQPHLPADLGFYDLRLPEVIRQQVELARQYGIHGFCFHYYWFEGRRLLEKPLDLFIENKDIDFPFCLCWANENWTRRWDGQESEILMSQEHSPENDLAFIRDLIPYLQDPRYIKIDGKPLIIVYRPSLLPDCTATLRRWREYCREIGIGEVFLAMVQFDVQDPGTYGFDAAIEFPPHKLASGFDAINDVLDIVNPEYQGHVVHYQSIVDSAKAWPTPEYPLVRGVFPGWDNEARRPGKGYTFAFATPDRYKEWLGSAVDYAERNPIAGERLVMINAWNEWAEGAHLEPDRRYGHAFLQATREVVEKPAACQGHETIAARRPRIVVVSHDAHPHGAQYLALNMCRELASMGFRVKAVLLGEGILESQFADVAEVTRLDFPGGTSESRQLARELAKDGIMHAIANTSVSGLFAADLKRAGMRVVSLVHELPGVIEGYGLRQHVAALARHSDRVVFAAEKVRTGFEAVQKLDGEKVLIRPQGLYKRNRNRSPRRIANARVRLREKLGMPADALIVLGVGYADLRKGADLFVSMGERLTAADPRVHLVWLGHVDMELEGRLLKQISATRHPSRIRFVGRDPDTDDYYAGADLLALTSREDPFPSVVMESLDVLVPVVGFSGAGGFETFLARGGGSLVPGFDTVAFADECLALLKDADSRHRVGMQGKMLVDHEFSFRGYMFDLLDELGIRPPRISVVVPNFNYARYMAARIGSIVSQTLPVYEIIVLDDASSDDSMEVLAELAGSIELRVLANEENSGSVFRQWLKGAEAASGDFIWIAEADDLSDPRFLETVMAGFAGEETVLSYCQSQQIDETSGVLADDYLDYVADISEQRWRKGFTASAMDELNNGLAVKNTIPNVSAVVFRRAALLKALSMGIEEIASFRIAGDWLTYLRVLEEGGLAFSPQSFNLHRRHGGSVTLGSDNAPHLREVLRMQKIAREAYGAGSEEPRAWAYANTLYRQFGLQTPQDPTVQTRQDLVDPYPDK